ncbi:MAG: TIGR00730 family Rossman fold protein [Acidobacteriota bacterium]|nr:TIGR00730 family Rossman fold protein [Acidobacteriota bacterium]
MKRVCVFCGSSMGVRPEYRHAAVDLGATCAGRGIEIVYGGGNVGLMGELADAALAQGGRVVGVIPASLVAREVGHDRLTELRVVRSMHERKAAMADLADGFIALPGGFGTLEEFCEILTWAQLGFHRKPCGLLNVAGYFDPLLDLFDRAVAEGFVGEPQRQMVLVERTIDELLARMGAYRSPVREPWLDDQAR